MTYGSTLVWWRIIHPILHIVRPRLVLSDISRHVKVASQLAVVGAWLLKDWFSKLITLFDGLDFIKSHAVLQLDQGNTLIVALLGFS